MQAPRITRAIARAMTEETALAHVPLVFETKRHANALASIGARKISDLKEPTFEDFSQAACV